MTRTFILSQKIKNTYRANNIIFSLRQIPLIKKLLPSTLYKSQSLKIFANIISIIIELATIFLTKAAYILVLVLGQSVKGEVVDVNTFLHIFTFLTIAGTVLNCHFFNASKDKFYAICLLKMDAKNYILSNYYYFLSKIFVGFLWSCLIISLVSGMNIFICIMVPVFVVCTKASVSAILLLKAQKSKKIFNEDKPTPKRWAFIISCVIAAYVLPSFGITINSTVFLILTALSLITGIPAFIYIGRFNTYTVIYKRLLTVNTIVFSARQTAAQNTKSAYGKQIDSALVDTKNKNGYAYFHEIFVKRHRITRSGKNTAIVAFATVLVALIGVFVSKDFSEFVNSFMLTFLPWWLYIMLIINRGQVVTNAMFMNCDNSMLRYRFYRQPTAILELFTKRLITLIKINLLPASIIAVGLPLLLYFSGGTNNILNYFVLFVSIIAMSVFFSVHFLILYYLLQPYNIEAKTKSSMHTIAIMITYAAVFFALNLRLPTILFGLAMIIFMVVYIPLAIFIAYKLAPKTFKLR